MKWQVALRTGVLRFNQCNKSGLYYRSSIYTLGAEGKKLLFSAQ
jgi:hypothetical protein